MKNINNDTFKKDDVKSWDKDVCFHPGHNFPNMISLPSGIHSHVCPGCKKKTFIKINPIF